MHVYTCLPIFLYIGLAAISYSYAIGLGSFFKPPEDDRHENQPRVFGSLFSRPKPEAEKQHSGGLKEHFGNVLKGGSIGFQAEFRPLAPIHGLIDNAKKLIPIPGIKPSSVVPQGGKESWWVEGDGKKEEPIPDYNWKNTKEDPIPNYEWKNTKEDPIPDYEWKNTKEDPIPDYNWKNTKEEDSKSENIEKDTHGWEPKNPDENPKKDGPNWEDIGENNEEYYNDHTTVPIEEIIQPRNRPKRRAQSKVFYLPLEMITNGKPYEVKIGTNDNEP